MRYIHNEKGIALVTSLLLTLIILGIMLLAVYFVTRGTVLSGFEKRYATARDASEGGVEILTKDIIPKTISGVLLSNIGNYAGMMTTSVGNSCFTTKLTLPTTKWLLNGCTASDSTLTLRDANNNVTADMTFTLSSTDAHTNYNYNVYTKIVDTVQGNTDTSGLELLGSGVVDASSGIITPQHFPYVYTIEVQGELNTGANVTPEQRANLSAVYAY